MHHQRRRSGYGSTNSSMTDVRKAVTASDPPSSRARTSRPAIARRQTPVSLQKLGKNPRDREREWEEERWWEEETQSFPHYCMVCEKQFVAGDNGRVPYCSDDCRMHDLNGSSSLANRQLSSRSPLDAYGPYSPTQEHRDIIPRASPSRPNSTYFSSPTSQPGPATYTAAISSLRSLTLRPQTPPPSAGFSYQSAIWPFSRSPASPSTSFSSRPTSMVLPSTYDGAYYGNTLTSSDSSGANGITRASNRPLVPRRAATYSRPTSIALVTPSVDP